MKHIDLTRVSERVDASPLDFTARVDRVFVGSQLNNSEDAHFFQEQGVGRAIDLKTEGEESVDENSAFAKADIAFTRMPVNSVDSISPEFLATFHRQVTQDEEPTLVLCKSGNRVGAFLALYWAEFCGHPKRRAFETACLVGLRNPTTVEQVKARLGLE